MSSYISSVNTDSYLAVNREHKTSAISTDQNDLSFAKALKILTGSSSTSVNANDLFVRDEITDDPFSVELSSANDTYGSAENDSEISLESSEIASRFSVLSSTPSSADWEVLNQGTSADDYSILGRLGDGLMTAAKFAASAYLGKVI
ncbi:MAG: hypothetical protein ACI4UM_00085 [Succinivibrio sp.]